jgi:hypothetical protein
VIYVPGNHEFYYHDLSLIEDLKARAPGHIHVLNDDQVIIDGVRFLGSILWTDFALFGEGERFYAMKAAEKWMTDFSIIRNDGRKFTPLDAAQLHAASRGWRSAQRKPSGVPGSIWSNVPPVSCYWLTVVRVSKSKANAHRVNGWNGGDGRCCRQRKTHSHSMKSFVFTAY